MDQGAHLQQCFENWFKTLNVQKEILKSTAMDINGRNKDKIIKDNNSAKSRLSAGAASNTIILYFKKMFLLSLALPSEFLVESSLETIFDGSSMLQQLPALR